ncbi:MAG: SDR family NAD(P)-dependent oxidoreductase [Sphaerochaetaceae bacterium]
MDLNLKDKVVLITGGSIGIGRAVAQKFLEEESNVIICARNMERLEKSVKELKDLTGNAHIYGKQCDVTKLEDLELLISFVTEKFNRLDILINNAGTGSEEKCITASDEQWYHYWDLHVMSAIRLCRLSVPLMQKNKEESVIINTTSMCATQPLDYEPIYNTTKAALNMYTKCLAEELIKKNIRVNSIAPGLVQTPDWEKTASILSKQQNISMKTYFDNIAKDLAPIGRFASAEEIADFYVFICSSLASYCVGANFHVDGGAIKVLN